MASCVFFAGDFCLGSGDKDADETYLIQRPSLKRWTPPIKKVKVWEERDVEDRRVIREGGRKVVVERCKTEKVEQLVKKPTNGNDDIDLRRALAGLDEDVPPEGYVEPMRVGVSAEVFREGKRYFSRVRVAVGEDVCVIWSSMNFMHMQGVVEYMANGRRYLEGGGVSEAYISAREAGCPVDDAALNGKRVGFILLKGSKEGVVWRTCGDIHDLYEVEKVFLRKAHRVYLENRKLSDAWHKANPPKPKNIKIRFWKRED